MNTREELGRQRILYLDVLRILAIAAVILMHTAGHRSPDDVRSLTWQICNIIDSGTRWAVPIFVMISGSLFLNKKVVDIKKLYLKNILRLLSAYLIWSFIYTLVFSTLKYYNVFSVSGIKNTIVGTLEGGMYHFWYIFMIIGLYMFTPVLRKMLIALSEKETKYLLLLMFLLAFLIPMFRQIGIFDEIFGENLDYLNMGAIGGGYIFYFILGYYLAHTTLLKKYEKAICILGLLSFIFTVFSTGVGSYIQNSEFVLFRENLSPNVAFMSAGLFITIKNVSKWNERIQKYSSKIANLSFGIYLVHELILSNIDEIRVGVISPVLDIVIIAVVTYGGSFIIVWLISRIPHVKKYII